MARAPRSRQAFRDSLASFLTTRAIALLAAAIGLAQLPHFYHKGPVSELGLGWDGAWYIGIARDGYAVPPAGPSNLAFPPLLPLLVRLLGTALGSLGLTFDDPAYGRWAAAGLITSNLAFFAALVLLWQLITLDHPPAIATWTLWLLAASPAGIFWSTTYSESLFL